MNFRISGDVIFRDLAGEAILLNLASGVYFGLDDVGTRMWHLLAEYGERERVIAVLLEEYEVEEAQLRRDFDTLIRQLTDKGLITVET